MGVFTEYTRLKQTSNMGHRLHDNGEKIPSELSARENRGRNEKKLCMRMALDKRTIFQLSSIHPQLISCYFPVKITRQLLPNLQDMQKLVTELVIRDASGGCSFLALLDIPSEKAF